MSQIMELDDFSWLQQWYLIHCNGDWEHGSGIHIGTIDNPGWSVKINLANTELQNKHFDKIYIERSELDWMFCSVKEEHFEAACGPTNLPEVLMIFRQWGTIIQGT